MCLIPLALVNVATSLDVNYIPCMCMIMTFSLTTPTGNPKRESSENSIVSVECEEPFASKASKRGKILTIGSPRACLILQSVRSNSVGRVDTYCLTRQLFVLAT